MAGKLSISKAWDDTRAVFQRDGRLITSVALALIVLPMTIQGLVLPPPGLSGEELPGWASLLTFAVALIGIAGQIAMMRLAMGGQITVGEAIAHGFRRLIPAFAAIFLFAIAVTVVAAPLLWVLAGPESLQAAARGAPAPGAARVLLIILIAVLLLAVRFQLTMAVATAESAGPIRILRRSWELTSGHYWRMLGFLGLSLFLGLILVIFVGQVMGGVAAKSLIGDVRPLSVGALVAALVSALAQAAFGMMLSVMLARIYTQVAGPDHARTSVPSSGT